jgi:hypothetical protein
MMLLVPPHRTCDDKYHKPNTFGSYFAKSTSFENESIQTPFCNADPPRAVLNILVTAINPV